jgi:hypothetical protein
MSGCGGNQTAGLDVAQKLAISPDGANVYVAAAGDSSLVAFSRELPPVCRPRAASGAVGAPQIVPLDCADPNGDGFELMLSSPPANGTLSAINQANDTVIYTPNPGFTGLDVFSYRATADFKDSNVVTATILVGNAGPPGPPGATTTALVALLADDRYSARSGKKLRLRLSTSEAATAQIELRRGTRTLSRVKRSVKAGTSTISFTVKGTATGKCKLILKVTAGDGRTATDSARLRVLR